MYTHSATLDYFLPLRLWTRRLDSMLISCGPFHHWYRQALEFLVNKARREADSKKAAGAATKGGLGGAVSTSSNSMAAVSVMWLWMLMLLVLGHRGA